MSGWIQIDIAESSRVSVEERRVELIDLLRERLKQRHTLTELYVCGRERGAEREGQRERERGREGGRERGGGEKRAHTCI